MTQFGTKNSLLVWSVKVNSVKTDDDGEITDFEVNDNENNFEKQLVSTRLVVARVTTVVSVSATVSVYATVSLSAIVSVSAAVSVCPTVKVNHQYVHQWSAVRDTHTQPCKVSLCDIMRNFDTCQCYTSPSLPSQVIWPPCRSPPCSKINYFY